MSSRLLTAAATLAAALLLTLGFSAGQALADVTAEDVATAKANLELVKSGEAKQVKCPFTGGPMNESKEVSVNDVDVNFCCGRCLAKAEQAEGDEQLVLLFGPTAFAKGFEKADD